ncbi:hypothetical protein JTB14_030037 [Gonioctena quinquepunctata]|nr:hypothetical protein JTB14_030037 [Gonioctena quinquepunctata]
MDFESSSERSQRLKTQVLRESKSGAILSFVAHMNSSSQGQSEASQVTTTTSSKATKCEAAYQKSISSKSERDMSEENSLAVVISGKLSRYQYDVVRTKAPDRRCKKMVPKYPSDRNSSRSTFTGSTEPHCPKSTAKYRASCGSTHVSDSELDQLCSQNGVFMVHQDIAPTSKPSMVLKPAILLYLLHVWFQSESRFVCILLTDKNGNN